MHKFSLVLGITGRMIACGVIGGALLGFAYGALLLAVADGELVSAVSAGGTVGFFIGGLLGLALGLFDGLALTVITYFTLRRSANPTRYRAIAYSASLLLTASGALFGFANFTASLNVVSPAWILYTLIPTLIAVGVAWEATTQVVRWVETTAIVASRIG